jgi:AraC-like DNA-binding protein
VTLLYYKCCAPSASDRELARVLNAITDHRIHHETIKALLERYPIWRHPEFHRLIHYPVPGDPQLLRQEMVKLRQQGWTEKRIAQLLHCSRNTVMKWLRREAGIYWALVTVVSIQTKCSAFVYNNLQVKDADKLRTTSGRPLSAGSNARSTAA